MHSVSHICRSTTGKCGDRINEPFVIDPRHVADSFEEIATDFALCFRDIGVGRRDSNATADGRWRVWHGSNDGGFGAQDIFKIGNGLSGSNGKECGIRRSIFGKRKVVPF